jgi:hypothetical protein
MIVLAWALIIGGFAALTLLGFRWTRPRPGTRRLDPSEEPGTTDPMEVWDRVNAEITMFGPHGP